MTAQTCTNTVIAAAKSFIARTFADTFSSCSLSLSSQIDCITPNHDLAAPRVHAEAGGHLLSKCWEDAIPVVLLSSFPKRHHVTLIGLHMLPYLQYGDVIV